MSSIRKWIKKHKESLSSMAMLLMLFAVLLIVHIVALSVMADGEISHDMQKEAKVTATQVSSLLSGYGDGAFQAAYELALDLQDKDDIEKILPGVMRSFVGERLFEECFYLDNEGKMRMSSGQVIPWSFRGINADSWPEDLDYSFYTGLELGSSVIYAVAPVRESGVIEGFFFGGFSFDEFEVADILEYRELEDVVFLIDEDGIVLLQSDVDMERASEEKQKLSSLINLYSFMEGQVAKDNYAALLRRRSEDVSKDYMIVNLNSTDYALAYRNVDIARGWKVVIMIPRSEFMSELVDQRQRELMLLIFDLIIVLLVSSRSVGVSVKHRRQLTETFCYDELTHTMTKEYFRSCAAEQLRDGEHNWCIAVVDLVGFRYVNELFGHERGDEIIRIMANLLSERMQPGDLIARNNADCFEMMIGSRDVFKAVVPVISEKLREFALNVDVTYPLLLRAGIVVPDEDREESITELIDKANAARKTAHPQKGVQVAEYSDAIQGDIKIREEIEASMESAMEHGEFRVFLQPKMDVQENILAGAEALVRWIRRDGTMVYPDEFMPIFESNGFVERLDFFMLEEVCKLQKRLGEEGFRRVPISVNQSQMLLMNPDYVDKVMGVLGRYDVPRHLIELELTETAFFGDKDRMIDIMKQLRDQNCIINIDDFGSGYSSLNMIKDIPFDILKIDRMFFTDSNSGTGRIILEKVVEMARAMNVDCICEGVETAEQEELLREIGCRFAQGYYYSRPIPAEDFIIKFMDKDAAGAKSSREKSSAGASVRIRPDKKQSAAKEQEE